MIRGHRRGCRCVGCDPTTRARGMAALLKRKVMATGVVHRAFTRFDVPNPRHASGKYSPAARRFLAGEISALLQERYPPSRAKAAAMSMARRARLKVPAKQGAARNPRAVWFFGPSKARPRYAEIFTARFGPTQRSHGWLITHATGPFLTAQDAARAARDAGLNVGPWKRMLNPLMLVNRPGARVVATLPASQIEVRYRRHGQHAGYYRHAFRRGVKVFGLSDGSVLIRGRRPAWSRS